MNDTQFVDSLLEGTKQDKIKWGFFKSENENFCKEFDNFFVKNNNVLLVLQKYTNFLDEFNGTFEIAYKISICDENLDITYDMYPDTNEENLYMRLYEIVERQVKGIDKLLDNFMKGIDIEIMPF